MGGNPAFHRLEMLTGDKGMAALNRTRVILFGVGGVGSWCAEALVRSGIGHLTIVDSDRIAVSNINRQVEAMSSTVGEPKVAVLAARLRDISPDAIIEDRQEVYDRSSVDRFDLASYDYVIDAIDSLSAKVELIDNALAAGVTLLSSLGASAKLDPTRVQVSSIWQTRGCRLGRFVRKRLRKRLRTRNAEGDFLCVHSDEGVLRSQDADRATLQVEEEKLDQETGSTTKQVNGSAVHITAVYGFTLAGLVVQHVVSRAGE